MTNEEMIKLADKTDELLKSEPHMMRKWLVTSDEAATIAAALRAYTKLPVTADGVRKSRGDSVFWEDEEFLCGGDVLARNRNGRLVAVSQSFSTRAAAEAELARRKAGGK